MKSIVNEFISGQVKKQDDFIKDYLHNNYPDLDVNDIDAVAKLVKSEGLNIEIAYSPLVFENNTVKQDCTIKITKQTD